MTDKGKLGGEGEPRSKGRKDTGWISSPHTLTSYQAIRDKLQLYTGIFSASSDCTVSISILSTIFLPQARHCPTSSWEGNLHFLHPRLSWACHFSSLLFTYEWQTWPHAHISAMAAAPFLPHGHFMNLGYASRQGKEIFNTKHTKRLGALLSWMVTCSSKPD